MKLEINKKFKSQKEATDYINKIKNELGIENIEITEVQIENTKDYEAKLEIKARRKNGCISCELQANASKEDMIQMITGIFHQILKKVSEDDKEFSLDLLKLVTEDLAERIKNGE